VEAFDAADPPAVDALHTLCAEQLVRYKVPRTIELIDTLPRNDAGKIRRSQLRDERSD
jgi:bile acid-coenzyme A ligase